MFEDPSEPTGRAALFAIRTFRPRGFPTVYILGASPPALPALRPATFPTVYTLDAAPSHRAHFPARNVPSRAHFLAAPAKTARTVRTFRHKRVPTVHTNWPLVYTVGGLPCRNVRTVGVLFAVNAFRPERVPAVYTYGREARGLDGA